LPVRAQRLPCLGYGLPATAFEATRPIFKVWVFRVRDRGFRLLGFRFCASCRRYDLILYTRSIQPGFGGSIFEGYNLVMKLQYLSLVLLTLRHLVASHLSLGVHCITEFPLQARNLVLDFVLVTFSRFSLREGEGEGGGGGGACIVMYLEPFVLDPAPVALLLHLPCLLDGRPRDLELLLKAGPGGFELPHLPTRTKSAKSSAQRSFSGARAHTHARIKKMGIRGLDPFHGGEWKSPQKRRGDLLCACWASINLLTGWPRSNIARKQGEF
jgi:hypothetical protein